MIRRIARPLLGSFFVYSGFRALVNPTPVAAAAEPLIDTATDLNLLGGASQPDNLTLARAYGGVQLGAGLLLATGKLPRISSLALAGTMAPATVTHRFWDEPDDAARQQKAADFLKDASLIGGLLIAGFDTEGKPGVQWRARRLAKKAAKKAAALGLVADQTVHLAEYADRAKAAAANLGERFEDRSSAAAERISDAVDAAKPRVEHAASVAAERASHAAAVAKPKISHAAAVAAEKAADAQVVLSDKAGDLHEKSAELRARAKSRVRR